jgi:16S rRNA processing protein RimM
MAAGNPPSLRQNKSLTRFAFAGPLGYLIAMSAPKHPVQMATIGAAHGLKGELRVNTFTGEPAALGQYGPLYDRAGRPFEVLSARPQGNVVVVRFKGVDDRTAAEALNGTDLFVDRSALPADLAEDEFYHADLVGLAVHDDSGNTIGRVTALQNYGGGDILEITLSTGKEALVPFTAAAVPQVALSAGFLRIDPVAAGLVDDEENDEDGRDEQGAFEAKRRPRGPVDAGGNR